MWMFLACFVTPFEDQKESKGVSEEQKVAAAIQASRAAPLQGVEVATAC